MQRKNGEEEHAASNEEAPQPTIMRRDPREEIKELERMVRKTLTSYTTFVQCLS